MMNKYFIDISDEAKKQMKVWKKSGNKAVIKKIERILIELSENPYEGIGKIKELKHGFSGHHSRRLTKKDRIVYEIKEEIVTVYIISIRGRYSDM